MAVVNRNQALIRALIIVAFILSCFGLALYLWISFGGTIPFQPKGYQINAEFNSAAQLSAEADVRISGVSVGRVKSVSLDRSGRTRVMIQIDNRYVPMPSNVRAIIRQKTLLGETYVELTPGTKDVAPIPDGGFLHDANVATSVQLDDVYRTFDAKTRKAFQSWIQTSAAAYTGRGKDISDAIGFLPELTEGTADILTILDTQSSALTQLIHNTGNLAAAVNQRGAQLQQLIGNANNVFGLTAGDANEITQIIRSLPTFETQVRLTVNRLTKLANNANPLITQLRPAARELAPLLIEIRKAAPDLRKLFVALEPLITLSKKALPALDLILDDVRPVLAQLDPIVRNLNPFLEFIGLYKREITAFFANTVASTQATDLPPDNIRKHYLRTVNPGTPEMLAAYSQRPGSNRPNAYQMPGAFTQLPQGLPVYENRQCGRPDPIINPAPNAFLDTPLGGPLPDTVPSLPGGARPQNTLRDLIPIFVFGESESVTRIPAPPCRKQGDFTFQGRTSQYPQVHEQK